MSPIRRPRKPPAKPIAISPGSLPGGKVGEPYSQPITATGGSPPYRYSFSGWLPPGLSLATGGVISGTPTSAGTSSFAISVADKKSAYVSQSYTVEIVETISPQPEPPSDLPAARGHQAKIFERTRQVPVSVFGRKYISAAAAPTGEPETIAWVNAVAADATNPFTVTATQQTAVNNLIVGLKTDFSLTPLGTLNLHTIFDAIWLFCIADSGGNAWTEARYDIVNQHTWTLNTGSSAAFTSRWTHTAGYTGVISDSNFLNTGITLSSFGGAYTLNSCHLMAMISNARTTAATKIALGVYDASTHEVAIAPYNSVSLCGWDLNESLHPGVSYPSSQGLWVANRLGSTQSDLWQNGVWSGTSSTGATTAVPSANALLIGGQGGNGASFSDDTIQAASFGAGLPGNLSGGGTTGPGLPWRINQYMQAVGAAWHF